MCILCAAFFQSLKSVSSPMHPHTYAHQFRTYTFTARTSDQVTVRAVFDSVPLRHLRCPTKPLRFVCIWVVMLLFAVVSFYSAYALLVAFGSGLVIATFIFLIQVRVLQIKHTWVEQNSKFSSWPTNTRNDCNWPLSPRDFFHSAPKRRLPAYTCQHA